MKAQDIAALTLPLFVACAGAPSLPHAAVGREHGHAVRPPESSLSVTAPASRPTEAPPAVIAALTVAGLGSRHAAEIVQSLTDEVGPRLAGSPGDKAAVAWALRALRFEGLSNVHAEPVRVPHWERGVESGSLVVPFAQKLILTALGGSVGTTPGGIEGEVVEVPSLEALDALAPSALEGKIVFIDSRTERTRDGSGYETAVGARSRGGTRAASRGAIAVVIRSIGTDTDRLPHTGNMRRAEPGAREIPAAALSNPDADLLHRILSSNKTARLRLTLGCRWLADADSANVIGELLGSTRAEEVVVLGAHLDSWDLGTGAVDDAAGVGIVMEAARLLRSSGLRPSRTLRIVLFANEENGLAGAKAYAKAHALELPRHVLALEADTGTGRAFEASFLGAAERRDAYVALVTPLAALNIARSDRDSGGGADLIPLRAAGVPAISIWQDTSRYFDVHHSANDTFDKIDREALAQVATAFALVAQGALSMEGDLGRIPDSRRQN